MSDHMTDQLRNWSPGQAMLPPDPNHHNRMLDRGAAEHLREVAPGLAASPAPPQPERTAETCFCGHCEYERDRRAQPPAPPAEAKGEMSRKEVESFVGDIGKLPPGTPQSIVDGFRGLLATDAALRTRARDAEEREAKWRRELSAACELSAREREIVIAALNQPPEHFYDKHNNGEWSPEHIAWFAIRSLFRERDEAREQLDRVLADIQTALHMSTAPGSPDIVEAMKWETDHHRHETERRSKLVADLAAERSARLRAEAERDEALTEANDLRLRVERLVAGAAKLTERAEEAEEELRLADFRVRSAEAKADGLLAKLAAAEAEVKRLTALSPSHTVALRLDEINAAFDGPIPTAWPKDVTGSVVSRIAALRERAERLVRAGDDLARWVDPASQAAQNWAAAKADAPAAGGGR